MGSSRIAVFLRQSDRILHFVAFICSKYINGTHFPRVANEQKWLTPRANTTSGNLSKPRRRRQRERHQTNDLMKRTMACTCVINLLDILSRSLLNKNVRTLSSAYFGLRERRRLIFTIRLESDTGVTYLT